MGTHGTELGSSGSSALCFIQIALARKQLFIEASVFVNGVELPPNICSHDGLWVAVFGNKSN